MLFDSVRLSYPEELLNYVQLGFPICYVKVLLDSVRLSYPEEPHDLVKIGYPIVMLR